MADPTITGPIVDSNPQRGKGIAGYTIEEATHPQSPEAALAEISAMHQTLLAELNNGKISDMLIRNSGDIIGSNAEGITVNLYPSKEANALAPDGIDTEYMLYDGNTSTYTIEDVNRSVNSFAGDAQPVLTMTLYARPQPVSGNTFRALSGPDGSNSQVSKSDSRQEITITFVDERAYSGVDIILEVHPNGSTDLKYLDHRGRFTIVSSSSSESPESEPTFKVNVLDEDGEVKGNEAILEAYEDVRWNYNQATEEEQNNAMVIDGYSAMTEGLFMMLHRLETLERYHIAMLGLTQRQGSGNPDGMKPIVIMAGK